MYTGADGKRYKSPAPAGLGRAGDCRCQVERPLLPLPSRAPLIAVAKSSAPYCRCQVERPLWYILSPTILREASPNTMIYDGHAYIFPNMRGDGGFDDRREFQRHLQLAIATHFMPVWRTRDRAEADNSGLLDGSMPRGFDALQEAKLPGHAVRPLRVDGRGRGLLQAVHAALGGGHGVSLRMT